MTDAKMSSTRNLASENGFHGKGLEASEREAYYSSVEASWPKLKAALLTTKQISTELKLEVSNYIGHQRLRTKESRAARCFQLDYLEWKNSEKEKARNLEDFFREKLGISNPQQTELFAAEAFIDIWVQSGQKGPIVPNPDIDFFEKVVERVDSILLNFEWRIEESLNEGFITSDSPVIYWRPRSDLDFDYGLGPSNATEIWVPIDEHHLLVLERGGSKRGVWSVGKNRETFVNAEIASRCFEAIFGSSDQLEKLVQLKMEAKKPSVRFRTLDSSGQILLAPEKNGETIIQSFTPAHDGVNN